MKIKKYKVPLYHCNLWVLVSNNFVKDAKKLNINLSSNANEHDAITFKKLETEFSTFCVFIRKDRKKYIDIISHESVHVVNLIFKEVGIELDIENDEPQAYLMGWVVDKIYKAIK